MDNTNNKYSGNKAIDDIMDWTKIVVSRYVSKSVIPKREQEDVEMAIVEKFLRQKEKIDQSFKGNSKWSTFYIAVINKMCCEVIRKESRHWYAVSEDLQSVDSFEYFESSIESDKKMAISYEIKRFTDVMLFFNGDRAKINLCLKIYFDIDIKEWEIREYKAIKNSDIIRILNRSKEMSKAEKYDFMAEIINHAEQKNTKGDAVRMWLEKKIQTILVRMNNLHESNHDKESLGVLLEYKEGFSLIRQKNSAVSFILVFLIFSL